MSLVDAYEVLIVGGGRAGQALAADLGGVGHRVAMIERSMIGCTCIKNPLPSTVPSPPGARTEGGRCRHCDRQQG
jgi:heterodisulfide reductase subunit A-like polyferredoxin